jgi:hypothetical protein
MLGKRILDEFGPERGGSEQDADLANTFAMSPLARSRLSVAARIEGILAALERRESVFIDTAGQPHREASVFYRGEAKPLATFWREGDSGLHVYPGVFPANPLFCRWYPAEGQEGRLEGPLRAPRIVRSGDVLYFGRMCAVEVPSRVDPAPLSPGESLALLLAHAPAGETVALGRSAVPSCDASVSRVHCTVHVLSKDIRPDGTFYMRATVMPGMPSAGEVALCGDSLNVDEIEGVHGLPPGSRLWLGKDIGGIFVPGFAPRNSPF